MNKLTMALGAALLTVLAGCKDPEYARKHAKVQDEAKDVPSAEETLSPSPDVTPVKADSEAQDISVTDDARTSESGSAATKTAEVKPSPAPEPEYTVYIVQRGDYLAKLSKKFNVKIDAIRKANPQIKNDVLKLGQKIKIPGKHEVGEQTVPAGSFAESKPKSAAKASAESFKGAVKEYTVVSGDTLGKIAYGNGINIRQLKEMNGLKENTIFVGQKLKIPASASKSEQSKSASEAKAAAPAPAQKTAAVSAPAQTPVQEPEPEDVAIADAIADGTAPSAPEPAVEETPVQDAGIDYVVQDGEDVLGLSIRFNLNPTEIREMNNLGEGDELKAGQVLRLPAGVQLN